MNKNLKTKNLKDSSVYFRPSVATDGIVFKIEKGELCVLLVKRALSETGKTKEHRPYKDFWALPGGFIRGKESAEEAVIRELKEETKLRAALVLSILILLWSIVMWNNNIAIVKIQKNTIDSLTNLSDSLYLKSFDNSAEIGRYETALDIYGEKNPKAVEEIEKIKNTETE